MLTFKELLAQKIITEAIHKELQNILDEPETDRGDRPAVYSHQKKLNTFVKTFKSLVDTGEDTGLEGGTPKKGSSRAVFFPKEPRKIHIDGKPVEQHTAVKIAFSGALDKHTGSHMLLGEHQNEIESDNYTRKAHSMLVEGRDGHYTTNEDGVTAPVLGTHPDNHWLEMAKADKMTAGKFKSMTKTDSHPKGLDFNHFVGTLQHDHAEAHGKTHFSGVSSDDREKTREHPLFQNTQDFMYSTDNHPGDLRLQNYGVWKHPVTGKEHPVIRDYGYSNQIAGLYAKANRKKYGH
jgi:hypothetical protein